MVICVERGADLHMAQLMPLPLTVSCFSKIQIGFTFLVPAHLGSPGKGPVNGCVCVWYRCECTVRHSRLHFQRPVLLITHSKRDNTINVSTINIVKTCQSLFSFDLPSVIFEQRAQKVKRRFLISCM